MTTKLIPSNSRGKADYGWLQANYSFSFANYFDSDRVQFGALRVLNDDCIAAGMGFGTHAHHDMEIITIPLEGSLSHRDSMGNHGTIGFGEVQVMSAGSGIEHSEMNASQEKAVKLLQLWVFPEKNKVKPRYSQKMFDLEQQINTFVNIVSPENQNDGNALWVHQQTFFHLGVFEADKVIDYDLKIGNNGIFLFLIAGEIQIASHLLTAKDALEVTDCNHVSILVLKKSKILLIEVPM